MDASGPFGTAILKAKLAESCERYEDMALFMEEAIKIGDKGENSLDTTGRNLFSVAFKNVIGARRTQWRHCQANNSDEAMKTEFATKIEGELEEWCGKVLKHIKNLQEKCKSVEKSADDKHEDEINYLKMEGDYNRYRAEYLKDGPRDDVVEAAKVAYEAAAELAKENLDETDPTRLGLMLNLSVFYYEVQKQTKKACELAKQAFDKAIEKLDTLNDSSYKDSTLIMQLLRDNLTLWTSENEDANNENED